VRSNDDDDGRLRGRVRGGEREAFSELYELYATAVYHHALRLTGDWSVAEEVMSETFLAAPEGECRGGGVYEAISNAGGLRPARHDLSGVAGVSKNERVIVCAQDESAKTTWAT
jgi:hypothetical protein